MNKKPDLKGIVFDFDGLILDTETAVYQAWRELYQRWGKELLFEEWIKLVGKSDREADPMDALEDLVGETLDREQARSWVSRREQALIVEREPLPGVEALIRLARDYDLKLAVASSSSRRWVTGHLSRLGLREAFQAVSCSDDVPRAKPDPAVYRLALKKIGLSPSEGLVFEDSPAGVKAAKRAGLYCVAVPNQLTRRMTFPEDGCRPDLVLDTLAGFPLRDYLREER